MIIRIIKNMEVIKMPWGDCTGPWWAQGNWPPRGRGFRWRYWNTWATGNTNIATPVSWIQRLEQVVEELKRKIDELEKRVQQ